MSKGKANDLYKSNERTLLMSLFCNGVLCHCSCILLSNGYRTGFVCVVYLTKRLCFNFCHSVSVSISFPFSAFPDAHTKADIAINRECILWPFNFCEN